jgi:iron complex transport system substrate-binding protein
MKKPGYLSISALILAALFIATEGQARQEKNAENPYLLKTFIDSAGRTVTVPHPPRRIVITCYGGASHEVAVLGGADKIAAQPSDRRFRQFLKMYPELNGIKDVGSFNNVNLEEILSIRPDLVISGIVSPQGNAKIERLGIPVFVVNVGRADIESLLQEFRTVGALLGGEKKAGELISFWRKRLSLVEERLATVPASKRKKVFYTSHGSSSPLSTGGHLSWGHHFIAASGGVNVAESLGFSQELTVEQLLLWNPDVLILSNTQAV